MSTKYKVKDNDNAYFVTITTVNWVDVFTRLNHKTSVIDSLKYCPLARICNPCLIYFEDYLFISARNYAELDALLNIELIPYQLKTYN